jgi:hypothetical protein
LIQIHLLVCVCVCFCVSYRTKYTTAIIFQYL